jgi:hypothetical protein
MPQWRLITTGGGRIAEQSLQQGLAALVAVRHHHPPVRQQVWVQTLKPARLAGCGVGALLLPRAQRASRAQGLE